MAHLARHILGLYTTHVSIEKDIRPISLTPIAAKVFESIVMKWIDEKMDGKIDNKQF